jgi:hypothetical protein
MKDRPTGASCGGLYYDRHHDTNDGKPWSGADIDDLKASLEHGSTA